MTTIHHTPKYPARLIRRRPDPDQAVKDRMQEIRDASAPEGYRYHTVGDDVREEEHYGEAYIHSIVDPLIRAVTTGQTSDPWPEQLAQRILCAMDDDEMYPTVPRAQVDQMISVMIDLLAPGGTSERDDVLWFGLHALRIAIDPQCHGLGPVRRFQQAAQRYARNRRNP